MTCKETQHSEQKMSSAELAGGYVRRMVENETRGWGDTENALSRLEIKYGLPFWTLNNLRTGRAKTVEATLYEKIRSAFADQCARHAARLLHEAEVAMAVKPDDDLAAIENQIRALASKLDAAKSEAKGTR